MKRRKIDMSPSAIDRRLRELAQIYRLGIAIKSARRLGKLQDIESATRRLRD